jgi:hypothetical protein
MESTLSLTSRPTFCCDIIFELVAVIIRQFLLLEASATVSDKNQVVNAEMFDDNLNICNVVFIDMESRSSIPVYQTSAAVC